MNICYPYQSMLIIASGPKRDFFGIRSVPLPNKDRSARGCNVEQTTPKVSSRAPPSMRWVWWGIFQSEITLKDVII